MLRRIYYVFLLSILSLYGCNDECEDRACNSGYCRDGECICVQGYSGSNCQNAPEPTSVVITKVEFDNLSGNWFDVKWDKEDQSKPDVYLLITNGLNLDKKLFRSRELYENSEAELLVFEDSLELQFSDEDRFDYLGFWLMDYDEGEPDEEILRVSHALYWEDNGMPEYHEFEWNGGVTFRLYMSYVFNEE